MANTFQNLSFETSEPGSLVSLSGNEFNPSAWTITEEHGAVEIAEYSTASTFQGAETFEIGWTNDDFVFAFVGYPVDLDVALFGYPGPNPSTAEDFEIGWSGALDVIFDLSRLEVVAFSVDYGTPSTENVESFDSEWGDTDFFFDLDDATIEAASFSSSPIDQSFEDFESEWRNTDYLESFEPSDLEAASFKCGSFPDDDVESFDNIATNLYRITVTSSAGNALFSIVLNGETAQYRSNGDNTATVTAALRDRVNGLSVGAVATSGSTTVNIGQSTLPTNLLIEVNLIDADPADNIVQTTYRDLGYWSQSGQLATEV